MAAEAAPQPETRDNTEESLPKSTATTDGTPEVRPAGETAVQGEGLPCCRICFETAETAETGRLFSPCKCTGSMRFVHVACLNSWRAASCNDKSYYRCDACHYEYRLQRLWLADMLLNPSFQKALTVCVFLVGALVGGLVCYFLAPWLVDWALDHLRLPPSARFLFTEGETQGNPACWTGGYTYRRQGLLCNLG